ncbi:hypothetical protein [Chondromyces crocatus]|uniref:Lipoprotein n=1 Tax=Chondromyces crocatus TaxID=52 RepID=A0A0K1ECY7_CHOCO|nr:hypothetical protein [Chondromyces crocatus]AKT38735.1 uncharacterized protein CMC5_028790 [Chondromyces crocatus]
MNSTLPSKPLLLLAASLALASTTACGDIDTFIPRPEFGGPAGVIEGTITYTGPPPCIRNGRVVGAAILLAFDTRLLPPPDGLGTTAASFDAVPGDELFASVRAQFGYTEGCPGANPPNITVSATWSIAPLPAGTYQIRGFYDLDGDFDPTFSISNLPTRGDIAGGAITNAAAVLAGARPQYRPIPLGQSGRIPEQGARVSDVAVTFALPIPTERPVFHVPDALSSTPGTTATVTMASDHQLAHFSLGSPSDTEASFVRLRLAAGVPADERDDAAKSPFFFPVGGGTTPTIRYGFQDMNGDGAPDVVPDAPFLPALSPISAFNKLAAPGEAIARQTSPTVIIQGLTLYKSLLETAALNQLPLTEPEQPEALIAVRPAALCLFPADPSRGGVLVVPHFDDSQGNPIIPDRDALGAALSRQFGREIRVEQGCLPEGGYSMNLVYGTGQAWTLPNEAGVCADLEPASGDRCGSRRRLNSQSTYLHIAPPTDPAHCAAYPTPALCLP